MDLPTNYCVSPTFNIGGLAPYYTDSELRAIPFQEGGIEPNQPGSEEDSNEEGPREPENNSIENDNSLGGSAFGSILIPPTLNCVDFNPRQDSQRRDEVIIQNQTQRFKTTNNQGKPTATSEQEKSDTQKNLITLLTRLP